MNLFKKLLNKIKKNDKQENESWYNKNAVPYDHTATTPNGEAYLSPDSAVIGISKANQ